jgi:hypothetical protein
MLAGAALPCRFSIGRRAAGRRACPSARCSDRLSVVVVIYHNAQRAARACKSSIEMSPASPIEMSLEQAAVETFGMWCDDGGFG